MAKKYGNWMDDCVHLRACRRLTRIYGEICNGYLSRGCNEDCPCYETAEDYELPYSTDGWAFCKESGKYDKVRVTCFEPD